MTPLSDFVPQPPDWRVDWAGLDAAFDWVRALRGCPQDPVHHPEGDVWIHTRMVLEALAEMPGWRSLDSEPRLVTFAAALLHDVAKPDCTRQDDDGRILSRGHSGRGAVAARLILWRMGLPPRLREPVAALVARHQIPFFLIERADAQPLALAASLTAGCDRLALVAEADARGRLAADRDRILVAIDLFREYCRDLGCYDRPYRFPSDHTRFAYFRQAGRRPPDLLVHDDTGPEAIVMSGLPASGKDHWIAGRVGSGLPVVSLDAIRATTGIDPAGPQGAVVMAARAAARDHLRAGRSFIWNATNLSRSLRAQVIDLLAAYRARVRIVHVEAPESVLLARNHARPRPVPAAVLARMLQRWQVPDLTEAHAVEWVES